MKKEVPSEVYYNYRISTKEGMYASFSMGLVLPFLGIYAVALDAPNIIIGLITAVPALVNFLMMIPAARYSDRHRAKLPLVFWGGLFSRCFFLPMAVIPYLAGYRGEALIVILTLMTIPTVIMNLSWTSLMGNLFPVRYRGQIFGQRNTWCGLVNMIGTVSAGFLLDIIPYPYNWTVLFSAAFLSGVASSLVLRQHNEDMPAEAHVREPYFRQLRNMLDDVETGKKFAVFLATSFLIHLGINFSAPLFPIYFARTLELPNSLIGWMATLIGAASVSSSMLWGRLTTLHGDDLVFAVGLLGLGLWPAVFVLSANPVYMLFMHVVLGVFLASFNLTMFNILLSSASSRYKSVSIATFHTLNSFTGIVGPFLGTFALNYLTVQHSLVASTIIRSLAIAVFFWALRRTLAVLVQQFMDRARKQLKRVFP